MSPAALLEVESESGLGRGRIADRGQDVGLAVGGTRQMLVDRPGRPTAGSDGIDDRLRAR